VKSSGSEKEPRIIMLGNIKIKNKRVGKIDIRRENKSET